MFFCNKHCRSKWDSKKFDSQKVLFICPVCDKEERVIPSVGRDRKYCSLKCLAEYRRINGSTLVSCDYCGEEFKKLNSKLSNNNFCTKKCSSRWSSENNNTQVSLNCHICNNVFTVGNNRKYTAKTCSLKCHYKHIADLSNNGHMKDILIMNGIKSIESQKKSDTLPEKITKEYLINNGIKFEEQKKMYDKFIVDFYLTDFDIVLEVYGDYWHANPDKYGEGEGKKDLNSHQKRQLGKDKARKNYLTKCGHRFEIIWEHDVHHNLDKIMKSIIGFYP